jgi:hypothetical protein
LPGGERLTCPLCCWVGSVNAGPAMRGVGGNLSIASPIAERVAKGRRLALLVLAGANLALMLALAGSFSALATCSPR